MQMLLDAAVSFVSISSLYAPNSCALQADLESFLPLRTLRSVRCLELLMTTPELPASWAGLTCLEKLALKLHPRGYPYLVAGGGLLQVASTVKELLIMVELDMASNPNLIKQLLDQSYLKDEGMPCLSSIEFCVCLSGKNRTRGWTNEELRIAKNFLEEQCLRAAECCNGVTLHASREIYRDLPDKFEPDVP